MSSSVSSLVYLHVTHWLSASTSKSSLPSCTPSAVSGACTINLSTCVEDETVDSFERLCFQELDLVLKLIHIVACVSLSVILACRSSVATCRLVHLRPRLQAHESRTHSSTRFVLTELTDSSVSRPCCWFALSPAVDFALLPAVGFALMALLLSSPPSVVTSMFCGVASHGLLFSTSCSPVHVFTHCVPPHDAPHPLPRTIYHVICWLLHQHHSLLRALRVEIAGSRAVAIALACHLAMPLMVRSWRGPE